MLALAFYRKIFYASPYFKAAFAEAYPMGVRAKQADR